MRKFVYELISSLGFPKRAQDFLFFTIQDVAHFKSAMKQLEPLITSTADLQKARKEIQDHKASGQQGLKKFIGTNVAFTSPGLKKVRSCSNSECAIH